MHKPRRFNINCKPDVNCCTMMTWVSIRVYFFSFIFLLTIYYYYYYICCGFITANRANDSLGHPYLGEKPS